MPAGSEPDAPRAPSAPLPLRFPLGGCCVGVGALTERKSTFSLATVMTLILLYQNLILVRSCVLPKRKKQKARPKGVNLKLGRAF